MLGKVASGRRVHLGTRDQINGTLGAENQYQATEFMYNRKPVRPFMSFTIKGDFLLLLLCSSSCISCSCSCSCVCPCFCSYSAAASPPSPSSSISSFTA